MSFLEIIDNLGEIYYESTLHADAMYYHAAKSNYENALNSSKKIKKAEKRYQQLIDREEAILAKYGNDSYQALDELEPIYVQMEDAEDQIASSYSPFLQSIAVLHFLCVASLETYINIAATSLLDGKTLEQFERISLEAKWLFLPKFAGSDGFNPGKEPFQSFSKMVKFRNALVHYKSLKSEWTSPGIPDFLPKLGLTIEAGLASLKSVGEMIRVLVITHRRRNAFRSRHVTDRRSVKNRANRPKTHRGSRAGTPPVPASFRGIANYVLQLPVILSFFRHNKILISKTRDSCYATIHGHT